MFFRLPPKKFDRTRNPFAQPGTSSKITHGAASECMTMSAAMPMSCCHDAPRTTRTSSSFSASAIHSRRSSYGRFGFGEPATSAGALVAAADRDDSSPAVGTRGVAALRAGGFGFLVRAFIDSSQELRDYV